MIRPLTLICATMAVGSGLYLYDVKHRAEVTDREIHKVESATATVREHTAALKTQYALLNEPERLAELASQHLPGLTTTQPGQWSTMADLDRRLPPVAEPKASSAPLEPEVPAAQHNEAEAAPAAANHAQAVPQAPAASAASNSHVAPVAAMRLQPQPQSSPQSQPHPATVALAKPQPLAASAPTQLFAPTAPATANSPSRVAAARPASASPVSLIRTRLPAPTDSGATGGRADSHADVYAAQPLSTSDAVARDLPAQSNNVPVFASALGMARTGTSASQSNPSGAATLYTVGNVR